MSRQPDKYEDELARRHRTATLIVYAVFAFTALLMALSLTDFIYTLKGPDPAMDVPIRVVVVFLGLGAIALRRARFAAPRLQAIASERGASGLIRTLEKTTIMIAAIAALIALLGFVLTLIYKDFIRPPMMIWIGLIAFAVLAYAFPRRTAWRRVVQLAREGGPVNASAAKGTAA